MNFNHTSYPPYRARRGCSDSAFDKEMAEHICIDGRGEFHALLTSSGQMDIKSRSLLRLRLVQWLSGQSGSKGVPNTEPRGGEDTRWWVQMRKLRMFLRCQHCVHNYPRVIHINVIATGWDERIDIATKILNSPLNKMLSKLALTFYHADSAGTRSFIDQGKDAKLHPTPSLFPLGFGAGHPQSLQFHPGQPPLLTPPCPGPACGPLGWVSLN